MYRYALISSLKGRCKLIDYELLTILLSSLAAIISVVSLIRTRKIQEEQMRLEKITAELSQRQLERMAQEDKDKKKANLRVTLDHAGADSRFWIRNHGHSKAKDVWITLASEGSYNPLVAAEYSDKIPISFLSPGGEVSLQAVLLMGDPGKYIMSAHWINEDDSQSSAEFFFSV